MIRRIVKVVGKVVGAVFLLGVAAYWLGILLAILDPLTREEAETLAIEELERSAKQLRFDAKIFRGPKLVQEDNELYVFEWEYSDECGSVKPMVLVEKYYRGTEFTYEGNLDRVSELPADEGERARRLRNTAENQAALEVSNLDSKLCFNEDRFRGPELIQEDERGYVFQWTYGDAVGEVKLRVSVDKHCFKPELTIEGDLERLRSWPCPKPPRW